MLTYRNILKLIYRQLFKGEMIGDDRSCRDEEEEEEEEEEEDKEEEDHKRNDDNDDGNE